MHNHDHNHMRRKLLQSMAVTGAGALAAMPGLSIAQTMKNDGITSSLKGNVNHSVSRWTYGDLSIEELCQTVKSLGFNAIDLVGPADW